MPTDIDLFGERTWTESQALKKSLRKRSTTQPRGYAAQPGSGPEGETCGSCCHLYRNVRAKTYLKCDLMRAHWTGGARTDIRARSPACSRWETKEEAT
ncbi:MAG: hypothetical protein ACJ8AD_14800 [Gemmatimonadaceae bacterium]